MSDDTPEVAVSVSAPEPTPEPEPEPVQQTVVVPDSGGDAAIDVELATRLTRVEERLDQLAADAFTAEIDADGAREAAEHAAEAAEHAADAAEAVASEPEPVEPDSPPIRKPFTHKSFGELFGHDG